MIVGVVGLGVMGRNHVRVLTELDAVDQVIGVDPDPVSRAAVERRFRIPTMATPDELLVHAPTAAVVATPASTHHGVALRLLGAGVPCLIEKPLAPTMAEAEAIVQASAGLVVSIGHVERFNPAILALKDRAKLIGEVLSVSTRRVGPYPARARDVGVRLDLLTHDIDIVRFVTGAEPSQLAAVGGALLGPEEDSLHAIGSLDDGTLVTMEVGWLSPTKVREVRLVGSTGTLVADCLLQELHLQEVGTSDEPWEALATFRGINEGDVIRFAIRREEPLAAELKSFLAAVRGEAPIGVSIEDGLEAIRIVTGLSPHPERTDVRVVRFGAA